MKSLIAVLITLAAVATAAPGDGGPPPPPPPPPPSKVCKPGTYSCTYNPETHVPGWQVCDVLHHWVFAGDCPPKTHCYFLAENGSPYCIP